MTTPSPYPPLVAAFLERLAHTPVRDLLPVAEHADGIGAPEALRVADDLAREHGRIRLVQAAAEDALRIIDDIRPACVAQGIPRRDVALLAVLADWAVRALGVRDLLAPAHFDTLTHAWGALLANLTPPDGGTA